MTNSNIFNDALIQRQKIDRPCGYLNVSIIYFQRFIDAYNSSEYGQVNLAFAHLYKAWDALYQSMILLTGLEIRKKDKNKNKEDRYKLGKIISITDSYINPLRKKKYTFKGVQDSKEWKIPAFKEIVDEVRANGPDECRKNKLFNSLDFLRELRNSSEHDFLEVGGGSYNALMLKSSPYIIPLATKYLEIYTSYYEIILSDCNTSKGHNKGRATTCSKYQIKKNSPKEIAKILHFPLPASLLHSTAKEPNASVSTLLKLIVMDYKIRGRDLMIDRKWHIESIQETLREEYLNDAYPYRSLSEVGTKLGLTRWQVDKVLIDEKLKDNQLYVLRLRSSSGTITTLYSKDLEYHIRLRQKQGKI